MSSSTFSVSKKLVPRPHLWSNNNMGGKKNQNVKIITNGVQEMLNDERIPNLASKIKWKKTFDPIFGTKGPKIG